MKTKGKGKMKNTSHASTIGTSNMLILVVDIPRFFLFFAAAQNQDGGHTTKFNP